MNQIVIPPYKAPDLKAPKLLFGCPHLNWYLSSLRLIPAGTYSWGASLTEKKSGTRIAIAPFQMGSTPITWGMWKEYRKSFTVPGKEVKLPDDSGWGYPDDHPVVNVSWDDIMGSGGFCDWASEKAGLKLTLPTDAQWEYAARGGKDGLEYPWGNDFDVSKLWCSRTSGDVKQTAAVDRTNRIYRNRYGLTDMVGNVWQWCADFYHDDFRPVGKDPKDNQESNFRCVRGASWNEFNPEMFRCNLRGRFIPDAKYSNCGFRLVIVPN